LTVFEKGGFCRASGPCSGSSARICLGHMRFT
jgi:hypothetical protein